MFFLIKRILKLELFRMYVFEDYKHNCKQSLEIIKREESGFVVIFRIFRIIFEKQN